MRIRWAVSFVWLALSAAGCSTATAVGDDATLDGSTTRDAASTLDGSPAIDAWTTCLACDDGVACTNDACLPDGSCAHVIDRAACGPSAFCDPASGCVGAGACGSAADCLSTDPCIVGSCNASTASCRYGVRDGDSDGDPPVICGGLDCDDANPGVHSSVDDTCDGVDSDCNGTTDDGTSCSDGLECVSGHCECENTVCTDGISSRCVDTTSEPNHCGACFHRCIEGAACVSGDCACPFETPDMCPSRCVDLDTDPANCGTCGMPCAGGACVDGACVCAPGSVFCPTSGSREVCADLATDPLHCGTCATTCLSNAACVAGRCDADAVWITGYGTTSTSASPQRIFDLDVGPAGDIYVIGTGPFNELGSGAVLATGGTSTHAVIRALPDGTFGTGLSLPTIADIAFAATDAGYVFGTGLIASGSTLTFGALTVTCPTAATRPCSAVIGMSPAHAERWSVVMPGTMTTTSRAPLFVDAERLGSDAVALVGTISAPYDFGGGVLATDSANGFVLILDDVSGTHLASFTIAGAPLQVRTSSDGRLAVTARYTGAPVVGGVPLPTATDGRYVARFQMDGTASGVRALDNPVYLAATSTSVAVTEYFPNRIAVIDATGAEVGVVDGPPSGLFFWSDGLDALGGGFVATGGGDVTLGTTHVPSARWFALVDAAATVERVYWLARGFDQYPALRAFDDDEVIVAATTHLMEIGSQSLAGPTGREATFIARVRLR